MGGRAGLVPAALSGAGAGTVRQSVVTPAGVRSRRPLYYRPGEKLFFATVSGHSQRPTCVCYSAWWPILAFAQAKAARSDHPGGPTNDGRGRSALG